MVRGCAHQERSKSSPLFSPMEKYGERGGEASYWRGREALFFTHTSLLPETHFASHLYSQAARRATVPFRNT